MSPAPDAGDRVVLDGPAIEAEHLPDWRVLHGVLHARFELGWAAGLALVAQVGEAATAADHHPELTLAPGRVDVRTWSHDVGGVTARDVRLAREVSRCAAALGATPRPGATRVLELALDTPDHAAVRPFWAALLGLSTTGANDELVDPDGRFPTLWFQDAPEPHAGPGGSGARPVPAQRWHLDLRLPPELVAGRIEAALAAGGTLVADDEAPRFWVLADPQGNRACLTTWQGRSRA